MTFIKFNNAQTAQTQNTSPTPQKNLVMLYNHTLLLRIAKASLQRWCIELTKPLQHISIQQHT